MSDASFCFSIDVLSDGSEYNGDTATLFLSLWKTQRHDPVRTTFLDDSTQLVVRYAVAACPCDVMARAAADQRYKLGPVSAVMGAATLGDLGALPGLLYATESNATLTVVTLDDAPRIDALVSLVHGHVTYPTVRICQVPDEDVHTWWKVHEDAHMVVHARRVDANTRPDEDSRRKRPRSDTFAVYLYTARCRNNASSHDGTSILIIPEVAPLDAVRHVLTQPCGDLPVLSASTVATIGARLVIQPYEACQQLLSQYSIATSDTFWLATRRTPYVDAGLLVRAQTQTRAWRTHALQYHALRHVPWRLDPATHRDDATVDHTNIRLLTTGCSLVWNQAAPRTGWTVSSLDRHVQREREAAQRPGAPVSNRHEWPRQMSSFWTCAAAPTPVHDDNEIDLDDLERDVLSTHDDTATPVQLLVLGTGCASPSPYRGASGYALVFPKRTTPCASNQTDIVVVVDVGEGFCTQWHRYGSGRCVSTVALIWISHAHWDHYGGLVNLLRLMDAQRQKVPLDKRPLAPWVVATTKVLSYVTLVLGDTATYFRPIGMDDATTVSHAFATLNGSSSTDSPILFWDNVRVDHSCHQAYGFVAGLRHTGRAPFVFGYSGDTRPCGRLVRACRHRAAGSTGVVDFLLHEATFDANEAKLSLAKKHSTVPEAIQVGRDVQARRLLLTHFSQRYDTVPDVASESARFNGRMQIGFALDGTLIDLY